MGLVLSLAHVQFDGKSAVSLNISSILTEFMLFYVGTNSMLSKLVLHFWPIPPGPVEHPHNAQGCTKKLFGCVSSKRPEVPSTLEEAKAS